MTNHKQEDLSSNFWASEIGRLNTEAVSLNQHISDISGIVTHTLEAGRITAPNNTISALTEQFSALSCHASSVLPRLDSFASILDTPSTLLMDNQKSALDSTVPLVESVGSILSSTASMAASIRSANENLCITDQGQIKGLHVNTLLSSTTPEASISIDSISKDTILMLGDRLNNSISTFDNLMQTSLSTSRLCSEVIAQSIETTSPYLNDLNQSFTALNSLSTEVYNDLIGLQSIDTGCFLFKAPTIEPYSATRTTAVLAGIDDETLDQLAVTDTDGVLDRLGDTLISRLESVNPELAQVYEEGMTAMKSGQQGWIRHAAVSFRTMFVHLLRHLAPDSDLRSFLQDPESEMVNGEFKRNARLRYIFREVATGSYARMAEKDIKLAEATFFPSNDIVHRLSSPLSEKQMRVFCRRIQGSVSVVLEAAGY